MFDTNLMPDLNTMDFDKLLANLSEDDIFKNFFAEVSKDQASLGEMPVPVMEPTLEQELPDLSALDIESLLAEPISSFGEISQPFSPAPSPSSSQPSSPSTPHKIGEKRHIARNSNGKQKKAKLTASPKLIIKQEPAIAIKQELKTESPKKFVDEKYKKRLVANKKSAQASRERKKELRIELESKVSSLTKENANIAYEITELTTENRVLKNEYIHLQKLINDSSVLSKAMAWATMNTKLQQQLQHMAGTKPAAPYNFEGNVSQTTAALYLMVVLHSFSQYFGSIAANPMQLNNQVPITVV